MAIIIVVDVHMDLGDGGGGAGHEQEYWIVSEPHDARCVAVECVCLVKSVVKLHRLLFVVFRASASV